MLNTSRIAARRAREFMQTDLLTLSPDTRVLDIHRMFVEEEIHGAPVVDEAGVVHGVVSTLDLLRTVRDDVDAGDGYFRAEAVTGWRSAARVNESAAYVDETTAADIMTRELVTVSPDAPLAEVAQTMREQHVHRVLVIEKRELLGVITTFDLLRAFVREPPRPGEPIDFDPSA